jgi:DHA2 family multidrug resistance protein-like MFS transporter
VSPKSKRPDVPEFRTFRPWQRSARRTSSRRAFGNSSLLAPLLVRVVRPAYVVAGGLLLTAAGLGILALVEANSSVALVVAGSVVVALGVAPPVTLGTDLVVGCVPPERAGVASAISEPGAELGGALGIAILGSISVAVYRGQIADAAPGVVPSESAASVEDTLSGAADAAGSLPRPLGETLLAAARDAFTQGMQVAALAGAAVAILTAIVAGIMLRRTGSGSPRDEPVGELPETAMRPA